MPRAGGRQHGGESLSQPGLFELFEAVSYTHLDVYKRQVQGNLDPVTLFGPISEIERRVTDILRRAAGRPGHIFNLGHGILPNPPVENVAATIDLVHKLSTR